MDDRRKKLLYQSWHRGSKETDELLGPFARNFLPNCSPDALDLYEAFSQEDDHDIWKWATGKLPTPPQYEALLAEILAERAKRNG